MTTDQNTQAFLSQQDEATLDPVTYEIIRHNLWMVNDEHGQTIGRLSGSPVANIAMDLNPAIFTATGEEVFFGPYIQHLCAAGGAGVKWILKNRSDNPGINRGDIFLHNDPWIGCNHQPDVSLASPVFDDQGEILCWVTNTLHQYDLGGMTPGSFCPAAPDVHSESLPFPPIKIVEAGVLRNDIRDLYLRQSRVPNFVELDLRASIAGITLARRRIRDLVDRYGPDTIRRVMDRVNDDSERAFLRRLEGIPDGTWSDVTFLEERCVGDRGAYRLELSVTKSGTTLTFSNEGTAAQVTGSLNCTAIGWKGSIMAGMMPVFAFDQHFAIGGALRHCCFESVEGTITSAAWPAAVSCGPSFPIMTTIGQVHRLLTKMGFASDELRPELCPGGLVAWPNAAFAGLDQRGRPVATILLDEVGGAMGPYPWRDGISVGGHDWMPLGRQPNVESNEAFFPLLYLYRKFRQDSNGAGKFRGGNTFSSAYVVHKSDGLELATITTGQGIPTAGGVFGGHPAAQTRALVVESDVLSQLESGRIPADIAELAGEVRALPGKSVGTWLTTDTVYEQTPAAAPGYGDPLDRDPALVCADVDDGTISVSTATDIYGVIVRADGTCDEEASNKAKEQLRMSRAAGATLGAPYDGLPAQDESVIRIHEYLNVTGGCIVCSKCGHVYCSSSDNYKRYALSRNAPITAAGARMNDPTRYVDEEFCWRLFFCPQCLTQVETDICRPDDEPYWDIRLAN